MSKKISMVLADKSERWEEQISKYCKDTSLAAIRTELNQRNYDVGDTDITYRMINHWDQHNLLPTGLREETAGWRKFTFVEMVWVRIVKQLREFGLPINKIAFTRECIMNWNKNTKTYDEFEFYIVKAWQTSMDPYLAVASDGTADIATLPQIKAAANIQGQHPLILISISTILEQLGKEIEEKYGVITLTEELIEILSEIQLGAPKKINLKIKSGKIKEIEVISSIGYNKPIAEIKKEITGKKLNGIISTKFEGGVPQSVDIIKRKKFK